MLSGHTHGGQIWPFGYLVRIFYPLVAGRYDVDGMTVIVGRGTGTWGPRMRLWHRGEILKVTLRRPSASLGATGVYEYVYEYGTNVEPNITHDPRDG
jgi:hypothetical protein